VQIQRIEAIIQSKFMMDEDNIQSLIKLVPTVSRDANAIQTT